MTLQIEIEERAATTKGQVKELRRAGYVPISLQHRGEPTLHLQAQARLLDEFIRQHGASTRLELKAKAGKKYEALVHDIQRDPVSHQLLSVTLQRVVRGEPIKTSVPLVFQGIPDAVKNRTAMVQHLMEQVEVRSLPRNLPDHITVELSSLAYGESLRVADLPATKHYEILTPPDTVLVALTSVAKQADEAAEAEPSTASTATPAPTAAETAAT
jgi:large subunit ribosomal protein L25